MGYHVRITVRGVRILADKVDICLAAVNQLLAEDAPDWVKRERELRCYDYRTGTVIPSFFSWLRGPRPPATSWATLAEALADWRFDSTVDANGNVTVERFRGEKAGDEEVLWRAIAPFVVSGGRANVYGEDSHRWRYVFQDGLVRLFHRNGDVWEKMAFLVDEQSTKKLIEWRAEERPFAEVDADRFRQVEDVVAAGDEDGAAEAEAADGGIDDKRFRVMLDKEPPEQPPAVEPEPPPARSILQAGDLSILLTPPSTQRDESSPAVVRLQGVRSRGVR